MTSAGQSANKTPGPQGLKPGRISKGLRGPRHPKPDCFSTRVKPMRVNYDLVMRLLCLRSLLALLLQEAFGYSAAHFFKALCGFSL